MIRYQARAAGVLVGRLPGIGRKAVVYPRAINFVGPDGLVLSLVAGPAAMSAHSILVPDLFHRRWEELSGETGYRRDGRFLMEGRFSVDFADARPWSGRLPPNAGKGLSRERLRIFREVVIRKGKPGGFLGLLDPGAENLFSRRAAEILREPRGLDRLVGLGPGLTPSGDDFLCGALLGDTLASSPGGVPAGQAPPVDALLGASIDRAGIQASLEKTSAPGRNLLWLALRGHFPAYLLELVGRIAESAAQEQMERAVLGAISHGETSGTDSSVGLVWYLEHFQGG